MSINSLPTSLVIYGSGAGPAASGAYDGVRARFGHIDLTPTGTMSASSSATSAALAANGLTADAWRSTAGGTQWLACTLPETAPATFIGICNHTMNGGNVTPQYWDGAEWQDLAAGATPTTDGPIVWEFAERTAGAFRLSITGASAAVSVGVFAVGRYLSPTYGIPTGWNPPTLNPVEEFTNQMTVGGQIVGRQVRRRGSAAAFTLQYEDWDFARGDWQTFIANTRERAFFAWWTWQSKSEVIYGSREPVGGAFSTEKYLELSFSMAGTAL